MRDWRFQLHLVAAVLASGAGWGLCAPAPERSTPATQPATKISDDARTVIDSMAAAYSNLKSLDLGGTISADIAVEGQTPQEHHSSFSASFAAPNKFRQEVKDDMLLGNTGAKVYTFEADRNAYTMADSAKQKIDPAELPGHVKKVLEAQNPSLLLAISKEPLTTLLDEVAKVEKLADTQIDGLACPTLKLSLNDKSSEILAIEPQAHLIRQARIDLTEQLKERRADLTSALVTVDYTKIKLDAPAPDQQFAWAPPAGARDAATMAAAQSLDEGGEVTALVGKDAPKFKIETLDGKQITPADFKGKVAVIDFWGTWCPPCRASMPHLQKLYEELKDKDLHILAIAEQDEKPDVEEFVKKNKLTFTVAVDGEGQIAKAYMIQAFPTTLVIGKDGKIKKAFIGFSAEQSPQQLKAAIEAAMKQ